MRYRDRTGATKYLRAKGVKMGRTGLACLASDGKGPKYKIINGRAAYEDPDLDTWVDEEAAKPTLIQRRRAKAAAAQSAGEATAP